MGQIDGYGAEEILIGGDGNPGTNSNYLLVLTQAAVGWSTERVDVGSYGITSIEVGQPTNRAAPGIYVGLRGTNGTGLVVEFLRSGGLWSSNILAVATNSTVFVLGSRSADVLACYSQTNSPEGALYGLFYTNGSWNQSLMSTNSSHRIAGAVGLVEGGVSRQAGFRLLDSGEVEVCGIGKEFLNNRSLILNNAVYYSKSDKWYFQTATNLDWFEAKSACQSVGYQLVTISTADENQWLHSLFPFTFHIGKYFNIVYTNGANRYNDAGWIDGSVSTYQNWASGEPKLSVEPLDCSEQQTYVGSDGYWHTAKACSPYNFKATGIGALTSAGGSSTLPAANFVSHLLWSGSSLLPWFNRAAQTNGFSVLYACIDDRNQSGAADTGDDFVLQELQVTSSGWTTNTFDRRPLISNPLSTAYGLALADFTGSGLKLPFTAEPDGQLFSWTATNTTNALQRGVFSADYAGKSWHALAGVKMQASGQGLIGLMVDPTNQSACNIIFWSPQVVLPTPKSLLFNTAPFTAVIPSANPLGSNAVVAVRIWDNEGNASAPFLQYQIQGATVWQPATLTSLDAAPYNQATRVAASPLGNNHTLGWNPLADVGPNIVTNILLRSRAQDFMLMGEWSSPTAFRLDTTIDTVSNPTNHPVIFTGITPVQGGIEFNWQGGTNAWLYLQRSPALVGTNAVWVNIWTGAPPTPIFGSYTDYFGTNQMQFYRIQVIGR